MYQSRPNLSFCQQPVWKGSEILYHCKGTKEIQLLYEIDKRRSDLVLPGSRPVLTTILTQPDPRAELGLKYGGVRLYTQVAICSHLYFNLLGILLR
jgi:hypothetical protein